MFRSAHVKMRPCYSEHRHSLYMTLQLSIEHSVKAFHIYSRCQAMLVPFILTPCGHALWTAMPTPVGHNTTSVPTVEVSYIADASCSTIKQIGKRSMCDWPFWQLRWPFCTAAHRQGREPDVTNVSVRPTVAVRKEKRRERRTNTRVVLVDWVMSRRQSAGFGDRPNLAACMYRQVHQYGERRY